jgi:hypothetical protein
MEGCQWYWQLDAIADLLEMNMAASICAWRFAKCRVGLGAYYTLWFSIFLKPALFLQQSWMLSNLADILWRPERSKSKSFSNRRFCTEPGPGFEPVLAGSRTGHWQLYVTSLTPQWRQNSTPRIMLSGSSVRDNEACGRYGPAGVCELGWVWHESLLSLMVLTQSLFSIIAQFCLQQLQ